MKKVNLAPRSAGFLIVSRESPQRVALALTAKGKLVLPKGHLEEGESDLDAAKREVMEEIGIDLDLHGDTHPTFKYSMSYLVSARNYPVEITQGAPKVEKLVTLFLAQVAPDVPVHQTAEASIHWVEIGGSEWDGICSNRPDLVGPLSALKTGLASWDSP